MPVLMPRLSLPVGRRRSSNERMWRETEKIAMIISSKRVFETFRVCMGDMRVDAVLDPLFRHSLRPREGADLKMPFLASELTNNLTKSGGFFARSRDSRRRRTRGSRKAFAQGQLSLTFGSCHLLRLASSIMEWKRLLYLGT